MAVDREVAARPDQKMLSAGGHLPDGLPSQVGRGKSRYPEVGGQQATTGERLVEAPRCDEDGIAFGHEEPEASLSSKNGNERGPVGLSAGGAASP